MAMGMMTASRFRLQRFVLRVQHALWQSALCTMTRLSSMGLDVIRIPSNEDTLYV